MYDLEPSSAIPFPPDLAGLCQEIVRDVPWSGVFTDEQSNHFGALAWSSDYSECLKAAKLTVVPDTGIVNFYNRKDTLMGHVDRAE